MPEVIDPDSVLPDKTKSFRPSQLMLWLLFPVILAVGFVAGLVVGIKQGQNSSGANATTNKVFTNTSIIPNANTRVISNTSNANTNVSNAFANVNSSLSSADYLKITPATQAALDSQKQTDLSTVVDQTASVTDIVRQQDLVATKYALKAYASVIGSYPTTSGQLIKIEGKDGEAMYAALKTFYGGSYNLKIDPESPTYYYGYTSNGTSFTLTAYLTSKKKAFSLTDGS